MNQDVLITSCVVVPDVRETRVNPVSIISLEDDLMRLFGSEKMMRVFQSLGVQENDQIEHKMLSSAIEKAQMKIEAQQLWYP